MRHVFIVGAKGISFYGGYESFLYNLLKYQENQSNIKYHIACKANGVGAPDFSALEGTKPISEGHYEYRNADCFTIEINEKLRSAQAIQYDCLAIEKSLDIIRTEGIKNPIIYILACRIGPFLRKYAKEIHKLGGSLMVNPDGHEWKRSKWSPPIRAYWKYSEKLMIKHADKIVCDSVNIEKYIKDEYRSFAPDTTYIAYGSEILQDFSPEVCKKFADWKADKGLSDDYYTVVGRLVPENNFHTIIREFMKSNIHKDLAIVSTSEPAMLADLEEKYHYSEDPRIKFVGTVYDSELLTAIRKNAFGYFHGHSVGGTNPSLLEALGSTKVNLLYDVGFNREVAEDSALYWNLDEGNLCSLIEYVESLSSEERDKLADKAVNRVKTAYSWEYIADRYQNLFAE